MGWFPGQGGWRRVAPGGASPATITTARQGNNADAGISITASDDIVIEDGLGADTLLPFQTREFGERSIRQELISEVGGEEDVIGQAKATLTLDGEEIDWIGDYYVVVGEENGLLQLKYVEVKASVQADAPTITALTDHQAVAVHAQRTGAMTVANVSSTRLSQEAARRELGGFEIVDFEMRTVQVVDPA